MIYFIYTITIPNTDFFYVGSTKNFNSRANSHKNNLSLDESHAVYKYKLYKTIRENGIDNWSIEIIENFECETKQQALDREKYWIETLTSIKTCNDCLNSISPISHLSKAERYRIYHETHKEQRKEYNEKNKDHITIIRKKRYTEKREEILQHAKEYREINKEQITIQNKKYSDLPPIQCECGGTYTYKHKSRHCTTLEHKLGTDSEFKAQYEEEQKQKKEEQKKRVKEYKAKWHKENYKSQSKENKSEN